MLTVADAGSTMMLACAVSVTLKDSDSSTAASSKMGMVTGMFAGIVEPAVNVRVTFVAV